MSQFAISDENPNVFVGGGGTITSGDQGSTDDVGPFIIFPSVTTDSGISPHVVLTAKAAREIVDALDAESEAPEEIDLPESDVIDEDDEIPEV